MRAPRPAIRCGRRSGIFSSFVAGWSEAQSGLRALAHHRSVFISATEPAVSTFVPSPRRGVRNDWAKTPRPRRPRLATWALAWCRRKHHARTRAPPLQTVHGWPSPSLNRAASETGLHLRSAREWVLRLAPCPKVGRNRRPSPFERTVARTCTWAVRLCHRCLCSARRLRVATP
jgi:hypothetical protein